MAAARRLGQAKGARRTRVGIMQIVHFGASGKAAASTVNVARSPGASQHMFQALPG
jgi:hypothetical protein